MGTRGNKFQNCREIVQTQAKFYHQFHFASILSSVSNELQNLFSTFGVVRNDLF